MYLIAEELEMRLQQDKWLPVAIFSDVLVRNLDKLMKQTRSQLSQTINNGLVLEIYVPTRDQIKDDARATIQDKLLDTFLGV